MAQLSQKNMLLLSSSTAAGNVPDGVTPGFLDFAEPWITALFAHAAHEKQPILFVPYARPGGMSEAAYFTRAQERLGRMGLAAVCAPPAGLTDAHFQHIGGIFIGGGHTYTLLYTLQQNGALECLRHHVEAGVPYLGSSAGTIITCPTIKTTNDMPGPAHDVIDLNALGLIGAQLNCHYMDTGMHDPKHQGETRDTRLHEFCAFNPHTPCLALYEGQALRVMGEHTQILTSDRSRGTTPPLFLNDTREEIVCEVGVPKDVSRIFAVRDTRGAPR
jgi:dipeptidase E